MKIADKIESRKRRLANCLNNALDTLPLKTRKWVLTIPGIAIGGLCLAMMITPFRHSAPDNIIQEAITAPVIIIPPGNETLLSPEDLMMLRDFKQTMDSLKLHDQVTYHEILQGREGLLDSIDVLLSGHP